MMPAAAAHPARTMVNRRAVQRARDVLIGTAVLMRSPVLAHGLYGILTRRGASTPNRGDGCRGDEGQAQYRELPTWNGEIDAPIEGLAIDDVDQNQAQCAAENQSVRNPERAGQNAFAGQHRDDLTAQHADVPQHAELGSAG